MTTTIPFPTEPLEQSQDFTFFDMVILLEFFVFRASIEFFSCYTTLDVVKGLIISANRMSSRVIVLSLQQNAVGTTPQ
jgi:hypothetical protein